MRTTLARFAVAMGAAFAATMLPATNAVAVTSTTCNTATSTRLLTGGLFGNTTDRLWVDHPTATRTLVCFRSDSLALGGLTVVADTGNSGALPAIAVGGNPSLCPFEIATVVKPVALRLAVDPVGNAVCVTVDTSTVTVQLVPGGPAALPVLEVGRDGGTAWGWIDAAACPVEYALYVAFAGPDTCMATNARLA